MKNSPNTTLSTWTATHGEMKTWSWGLDTVICGGEVEVRFEGVSFDYFHPYIGGSGPAIDHKDIRNSSCFGCPHLGIDHHGWRHCAHPLWIELFGCPQSLGTAHRMHTGPDCPMTSDDRWKKLYKLKEKIRRIFWDYYHASGKNPYKAGFYHRKFL